MTEYEELQNLRALDAQSQKSDYEDLLRLRALDNPQEQKTLPLELPQQSNLTPEGNKWVNAPDLRDMSQRDRSGMDIAGGRLTDMANALPGIAETGIDAISQGVTFGLADEIAGVVGAPVRMAMNGSMNAKQAYIEARDAARNRSKQLSKRDPGTAFAGEMAGGIASGNTLLKSAMAVPKIANALTKAPILTGAGMGAVEGGAYGFGASEGDDLLKDTLKGAVLSGGAGAAGAGLSKLFRPGNMSDDYARVAEAERVGYPLSWSETINKKPIEMGENILGRTWVNPTLKNVQKRQDIINKAIVKESGVKGLDEGDVDGLYTYLTSVNKMNPSGRSKSMTGKEADNLVDTTNLDDIVADVFNSKPIPQKRQYNINKEFEDAFLGDGVFDPQSGVNTGKLASQLGFRNPARYGVGSDNKLSNLTRLASKLKSNSGKVTKQDETNSLLTFLGFTGIGAGVGGPAGALAALLTPDVGSVLMKGGNKLAQTKGLDRKMAQAAINMSNQMNPNDRMSSVDSLMGVLGLLGDVAPYAAPAYGAYRLGSKLY